MRENDPLPVEDHHVLLSPQRWRRRAALWIGAGLVALAAIAFARGSDECAELFERVVAHSRWWPLLIIPAGFGLLAWLTQGVLREARGSGIPQVIAALEREEDAGFAQRVLALPIAAGKLVLTLLAMLVGASVGREGPTVHVGAGLMVAAARRLGFREAASLSRFALAGGAAGIAAAFNAPLAGVVFAIEELAGAFEHRFSGALLTAVMIGGVVSLGVLGDYAYFGRLSTALPLGQSWLAVLATGVVGGLAGGAFSRAILAAAAGLPGVVGRVQRAHPVLFAAGCGLALALLGVASGDSVYGTGYAQARDLLAGGHGTTAWFGVDKLLANAVSYAAGIPGGIFSPSLAVGAGLGANLAPWLPHVQTSAVILLGMAAYLTGVTQAPLTSAVICMELTDDHGFVLPIMAACLIGRAFSSLICKVPVYRAFALRLMDERERVLAAEAAASAASAPQSEPAPSAAAAPATQAAAEGEAENQGEPLALPDSAATPPADEPPPPQPPG